PGFADSVRVWERRLGELNVMVEAVEPPPALWDKISAEIGDVTPLDTTSSTIAALSAPGEARLFIADEAPLPVLTGKPAAEPFRGPSAEDKFSESLAASLAKALDELPSDAPDVDEMPPVDRERGANVVQLTRRMKKWRGVAIAMQAIAAVLAI